MYTSFPLLKDLICLMGSSSYRMEDWEDWATEKTDSSDTPAHRTSPR